MRMSRLCSTVVFAGVLALGTVACGGGDDEVDTGAGASTTVAAASSESAKATETTAAKAGTGTTTLGSGGGAFCEKNREQLKSALGDNPTLTSALLSAMADPVANREKLRTLVKDAKAQNESIVKDAPAEIKAELELMLKASSGVIDALEKADFDLSKVDLTTAAASLGSPDFTAASTKVQAYFKDRCGIDLGMG